MGWDLGRWGVTFECGTGPLLRTCVEGKSQPSTKEGPLECGVPVFRSRALSEGVWVGFRPSVLEGVSECSGRSLGGGVVAGFVFCAAGGSLRGQRIRPGSPTGFPVPKWTGKHWPCSLLFLRALPPPFPPGSPPSPLDP